MCSSACKHARPGTPCYCNCHGRAHGIYYGRSRSYYRSRPRYRRVPQRSVRLPRLQGRETPSRAATDLARQVLKSAVIGVSCGVLPGACPAIVALGKLDDVYRSVRDVVNRVRTGSGLLRTAGVSLVRNLAAEVASQVTGPWIRGVSDGIASRIVTSRLDQQSVRRIASSTIFNVMKDGVGDLVLWGQSDR
jgi:hypothetical protein